MTLMITTLVSRSRWPMSIIIINFLIIIQNDRTFFHLQVAIIIFTIIRIRITSTSSICNKRRPVAVGRGRRGPAAAAKEGEKGRRRRRDGGEQQEGERQNRKENGRREKLRSVVYWLVCDPIDLVRAFFSGPGFLDRVFFPGPGFLAGFFFGQGFFLGPGFLFLGRVFNTSRRLITPQSSAGRPGRRPKLPGVRLFPKFLVGQFSRADVSDLSTSRRLVDDFITMAGTPNFAQENEAIKRQKLDGGKCRQILNIKPQTLPHKTKSGIIRGSSTFCKSTDKTPKEGRKQKIYTREPAAPFVSITEMMNKFQSNTRDISLSRASSSLAHDAAAFIIRRKPKLTLTVPKKPELETSQRVRSVRAKSSAELKEEMMAKIPKFKARPINKKILEAPTLPALPRSTPQVPIFHEFHLETMARAINNSETFTVASAESLPQNQQWKPHHLTEPRPPTLQTSLRARPPRIKSSEELEKIPKFKARPLNKKIFESKGELGVFSNTKKQVTIPQEFHFAKDERIPPPATVADLFDKLSLNSETRHNKQPPRKIAPNPFHLRTEERGSKKENKFVMELHRQLEEERARVPKANPCPYTTGYPVLPPKPVPKPCTEPEPFQLESLVRHEEELQREIEERQRMEREEARMRDPIPVPEKIRKPLTEVQEFKLHVEHRAVERAEFDKKVKEKEETQKRYREEAESEKMMEEEKALKQLRRTLVPRARTAPDFNHPFLPQRSSKEVTKPKSPKLKIRERKERPKLISVAISSAASNMR